MVRHAVKAQRYSERAVLALGYLAFEYRFVDDGQAIDLGKMAVEWAREQGNPSLIAKNLCSLGQTLFFADHAAVADARFIEAEELLSTRGKDEREVGRVGVYRTMVSIRNRSGEELTRAWAHLKAGRKRGFDSGDLRRQGTASTLQGIVSWHRGNRDEAKAFLVAAIDLHFDVKDGRNLVFDILTYAGCLRPTRAPWPRPSGKSRWSSRMVVTWGSSPPRWVGRSCFGLLAPRSSRRSGITGRRITGRCCWTGSGNYPGGRHLWLGGTSDCPS